MKLVPALTFIICYALSLTVMEWNGIYVQGEFREAIGKDGYFQMKLLLILIGSMLGLMGFLMGLSTKETPNKLWLAGLLGFIFMPIGANAYFFIENTFDFTVVACLMIMLILMAMSFGFARLYLYLAHKIDHSFSQRPLKTIVKSKA